MNDLERYAEASEELVRLLAGRLGRGHGHLLQQFAQSAAILHLAQPQEFLLQRLVRIEIPGHQSSRIRYRSNNSVGHLVSISIGNLAT